VLVLSQTVQLLAVRAGAGDKSVRFNLGIVLRLSIGIDVVAHLVTATLALAGEPASRTNAQAAGVANATKRANLACFTDRTGSIVTTPFWSGMAACAERMPAQDG
jgi:hypothetical protein